MEKTKNICQREKRHRRIRKKVKGTEECPRLIVNRSLKHIYVQIIDDTAGKSLFSLSSLSPSIKEKVKNGGNIKAAKLLGEEVALKAIEKGIKKVVFDRAGYLFHGRVKALATAAREKGLNF